MRSPRRTWILEKLKLKILLIAFAVTLRKSVCTFRTVVEDRGLEHDRSRIFISHSSRHPQRRFVFPPLRVPHCSPLAIVSRFVRPRSTRSNWSREKLGVYLRRTRSLAAYPRRKGRICGSRGSTAWVRERRRGRTHCGGSCHWGFGNMSVYASRIAFGNVSSNLFHCGFCLSSPTSPIYEKAAAISCFKKKRTMRRALRNIRTDFRPQRNQIKEQRGAFRKYSECDTR